MNKNATRAILVLSWLLGIAVLFLAVTSFGIYYLNWQGPAIEGLVASLPYPAVIVNWRLVTIDDYNRRVASFQRAVTYNQAFDFNDPANAESVKQQRELLFERMIDLKLEENLAKSRGIQVASADIERELEMVSDFAGRNQQDLNTMLERVYGWSQEEFVAQVVIPELRERQLKVAVNKDREVNRDAHEKADLIKSRLAAGEDFSDLAKAESDDVGTGRQGGDLGWAGLGAFVPEFEQALVRLEPGQVSEPVATVFGLHLIQLLEKNETDPQLPQYHARHILVQTPDLSEWLTKQREGARIWRLMVVK